jgi:hypothetical protein
MFRWFAGRRSLGTGMDWVGHAATDTGTARDTLC